MTVHFRHLTPGVSYLWHVHQAKKAGDPCERLGVAGPPYPGWDWSKVNPFKTNAAGNYNKTLKTKTFPVTTPGATAASSTTSTSTSPTGRTVIACGVFKGSRKATPKWKKAHRRHGRGHRRQQYSTGCARGRPRRPA